MLDGLAYLYTVYLESLAFRQKGFKRLDGEDSVRGSMVPANLPAKTMGLDSTFYRDYLSVYKKLS